MKEKVMEITEKRDVVLARVDWNDELQVELDQERRHGVYTVDQAEELAAKLIFASAEIRKRMVMDDVEREARLRAEPLAAWEQDFIDGRPIGEHADVVAVEPGTSADFDQQMSARGQRVVKPYTLGPQACPNPECIRFVHKDDDPHEAADGTTWPLDAERPRENGDS